MTRLPKGVLDEIRECIVPAVLKSWKDKKTFSNLILSSLSAQVLVGAIREQSDFFASGDGLGIKLNLPNTNRQLSESRRMPIQKGPDDIALLVGMFAHEAVHVLQCRNDPDGFMKFVNNQNILIEQKNKAYDTCLAYYSSSQEIEAHGAQIAAEMYCGSGNSCEETPTWGRIFALLRNSSPAIGARELITLRKSLKCAANAFLKDW